MVTRKTSNGWFAVRPMPLAAWFPSNTTTKVFLRRNENCLLTPKNKIIHNRRPTNKTVDTQIAKLLVTLLYCRKKLVFNYISSCSLDGWSGLTTQITNYGRCTHAQWLHAKCIGRIEKQSNSSELLIFCGCFTKNVSIFLVQSCLRGMVKFVSWVWERWTSILVRYVCVVLLY